MAAIDPSRRVGGTVGSLMWAREDPKGIFPISPSNVWRRKIQTPFSRVNH
jgi:hypothetical protein